MVKIIEIVRDSRNGGCPAVPAVDGDLRLAQGETVSAGMALVQLDDPDAGAQISFDLGEDVLAVPESLILKAADEIRARGMNFDEFDAAFDRLQVSRVPPGNCAPRRRR